VVIALLVAVALAQEPADPVAAVDPTSGAVGGVDSTDGHAIIVYGDLRVEEARKQLIHDLQEQGYTQVIDKGDYVILRNVDAWKGDIIVHDDGWVRMKRQPIRVQSRKLPWAEQGSPLAWASCALYPPMCLRTGGAAVGRRKWLGAQDRTMDAIDTDVETLGDRVADAATDGTVNDVPERMEALWNDGVWRDGDLRESPAEKKATILEFWDTRTDTVWGDRVRAAVEAFVRAEVQTSDTPFTHEEIAAFNQTRSCERELDLWAEEIPPVPEEPPPPADLGAGRRP
jgi:hypothetical protein